MKFFCFCLELLFLSLVAVQTVASAATPNIIFIMADDLGWADVAFHQGNVPTPYLDRLASEGVELTQHYVYQFVAPLARRYSADDTPRDLE